MKRMLVSLLAALLLQGVAGAETVMFTADLHMGDGTAVKDEVLDALLDKAQDADALIILGDVTNNGKASEVEEVLSCLAQSGARVLVLPGNHDLSVMEVGEFNELFHAYGLDQAYDVDASSGSMAVHLTDELDVVLLNTAMHDSTAGNVSDATLAWLTGILSSGRRVLVCGHHPILPHSVSEETRGDLTAGREKLVALLNTSPLPIYLAGHRHIGHWVQSDGLTEILAGKTDAWPITAGVLTVEDTSADFTLVPLLTEDNPAQQTAEAEVDALARSMGEGALKGTSWAGNESMIAYFMQIYKAYVSGHLNAIREECLADARYEAWQSEEITSIFKPWLAFLLSRMTQDYSRLQVALN